MIRIDRRTVLALFGAIALTPGRVTANGEPLSAPGGAVLLTVTGAIGKSNRDGAAEFDLDMLQALDRHDIRTSSIWTEGVKVFTGVPLSVLLAAVEARGRVIEASASNDYLIEIPVDEIEPEVPIIAYLSDGAPMSLRDKGPLWLIYPYDSDSRYRSETVLARSVWQLDRIEVRD